jgi:hypothetical protein
MPMTDSGLSAAIKSAIEGLSGAPSDPAELQKFCDALGQAIVEYLKANALVSGTVTSGAGAGGSVTGSLQ